MMTISLVEGNPYWKDTRQIVGIDVLLVQKGKRLYIYIYMYIPTRNTSKKYN